jgi:hypothetical protein
VLLVPGPGWQQPGLALRALPEPLSQAPELAQSPAWPSRLWLPRAPGALALSQAAWPPEPEMESMLPPEPSSEPV